MRVLFLLAALAASASAQDGPCPPLSSYERSAMAGHPRSQAWWARPSVGRFDRAYYVGGGSPGRRCADVRACDEGTFGWDYGLPLSRIRLLWHHGRKFQAGEGQYEPDRCVDPLQDTLRP